MVCVIRRWSRNVPVETTCQLSVIYTGPLRVHSGGMVAVEFVDCNFVNVWPQSISLDPEKLADTLQIHTAMHYCFIIYLSA